MDKKLKKQIKNICFWSFCCLFWYLVLSFFLLSDYPIQEHPFNLKKAYDVIKDALGLIAAFLAPVTAIVLFRDWRKEHALIKNEELSLEIQELLKSTYNNMTTIPPVYEDEPYAEAVKRHFEYLMALNRLEKDLTLHDEKSLNYLYELKKINQFSYECALDLQKHYYLSKDESYKEYILKGVRKNNSNAQKLKEMIDELEALRIFSE